MFFLCQNAKSAAFTSGDSKFEFNVNRRSFANLFFSMLASLGVSKALRASAAA